MDTFTLQPVASVWIVVILAVCALLMMLVRPSFSKVSDKQRKTLNLLRMLVVFLALFGLLRPGCVHTEEKLQSGVLLCLLDTSRSMELPHVTDDSTRWETIVTTMKRNAPKFQELADKKIDVRFFGFDNNVVPLEFDGMVKLPAKPEGGETDVAAPVYESAREARGERLIGVILMSDGVSTVLNPDVETSQAVVPLVNMETPLYSIPLGSSAASGQSRDVSITNFAEQHVVNVKNQLSAEATVVARGYQNQDVRVELLVIDGAGQEKLVNTQVVTPSRSVQEIPVRLKYKPTEPGEFRLKIRVAPMPDEIALRNNALDAFLTVNDKGLSVVLIDGGMGWEQSYMRRSLATAEFLDLRFLPIYPDEREAGPREDLVEIFEDESVDVFILSNIDSRLLYDEVNSPMALKALAEAVTKRKKGFLMLGGYHSFGPGLYHETPLAEILPIEMRKTERQEFNADIVRKYHISGELKMKPTSGDHFLTRADEDSIPWSERPPLAGANRFDKVKRNASILLESDDQAQHPLMVASIYGGRVLAFAGDSIWRWNMKGLKQHGRTFKPEYDKFWRQVILWLAGWDARNDDSISLEFPQRRFQPKGRVKFGVNAQSITGEPLTGVTYKAVLTQPDGKEQNVAVTTSGSGNWNEVDREMILQPGLYLLEVEGSRNGDSLGMARRQFVVVDRDVEKSNPVANRDLMDSLAKQTRDFGGKLIDPEELDAVLDAMIKDPPVEKIQIPTKWKFGETFLGSLGFLLVFVALLATEWVLRKKWGLV